MNAPEQRQEALSLGQLIDLFKSKINPLFATPFLVCAEIHSMDDIKSKGTQRSIGTNYKFIEPLIANRGGVDRLTINGVIWNNNFDKAVANFVAELGTPPATTMKVMFWAKATYNDFTGGMQLDIQSFDPTYSLGDVEAQRRKIRRTLEVQGLFDKNKALPVPASFAKVVVITGDSIHGAMDFKSKADVLAVAKLTLFRYLFAKMQGAELESSICQAFDHAWKIHDDNLMKDGKGIDAIVLIRGGGDSAHLDQFTNMNIALKVATSPVPVFIGIGHQNDKCILDEIACKSFATPSMVATAFVDAAALQAEKDAAQLEQFLQLATERRANHEDSLGQFRGKLVARASDQLDSQVKRHAMGKQTFINHCAPAIEAVDSNLSQIRNGILQRAEACQKRNEGAATNALKQLLNVCDSRLTTIESGEMKRRIQGLCHQIRDRAETARRNTPFPPVLSIPIMTTLVLAISFAGYALLASSIASTLLAGFAGVAAIFLWRRRSASITALRNTHDNRYQLLLQHIKNLETSLH